MQVEGVVERLAVPEVEVRPVGVVEAERAMEVRRGHRLPVARVEVVGRRAEVADQQEPEMAELAVLGRTPATGWVSAVVGRVVDQ